MINYPLNYQRTQFLASYISVSDYIRYVREFQRVVELQATHLPMGTFECEGYGRKWDIPNSLHLSGRAERLGGKKKEK